jgi:hypothetical protein
MKFNLFGAGFIITMALLIFKALGYITIGWFWVFLPMILMLVAGFCFILFFVALFVLAAIFGSD